MIKWFAGIFLLMAFVGSIEVLAAEKNPSHFIGITDFDKFEKINVERELILTSREIKSPIAWNELVVSWNASAPTGTYLKVEARGIYPDHVKKFYTMGLWSEDAAKFPRESVKRQKDADGNISTDTLVLTRPAQRVQIRITLGGTNNLPVELKFIGLSFLDSREQEGLAERVPPNERRERGLAERVPPDHDVPPNKKAWGKIIETPERSQNSYPEEEGWCSPTSLAMVMMRWADALHRPELKLDVPECAAGVLDKNYGTGNWPFNTAFAGKFPGMRAYVSRFNDIAELEDWIVAGIPVIISAPFHLLEADRKNTGSGHVVTVIGFTENGDVVINDPATNLEKGQKVRHIYKRENVAKAWMTSHNTVYLVYPESAKIPKNRFEHWEKK